VSYRDDESARADRANALIDEIADLERKKVAQAQTEQRLEAARNELRDLQAASRPALQSPPQRVHSAGMHLVVFAVAAMSTYVGYTLLV
jgi:hypothetical protein